MAITKAKKQEILAGLEQKMNDATGVAFLTFDGLTVDEAFAFRNYCRDNDMTYTVAKKTLMSLAAKDTNTAEFDSDQLAGAVAMITHPDDVVMPAATIKKFIADTLDKATKESKVAYAGAVYEGALIDQKETAVLAATPSKEESYGKIVGMLTHGTRGIHGVLQSGLKGAINVLQSAEKFASA